MWVTEHFEMKLLRLCCFMLKVLSLLGSTGSVREHKFLWLVVDNRRVGRSREAKGHHQH